MLSNVMAFETRRMVRNIPSMFFGVFFPAILLAIFGGMYGNEPTDVWGGLGTVDVSVPRYAGLVVAVAGMVSFPLGLVEYRKRGFLPYVSTTPVHPRQFLRGQLLINAAVCLAGLVLLIALGAALGLNAPKHPLAFIAITVLATAAMFTIGTAFMALLRHDLVLILIANVLHLVMIFWSGAAIPLEFMPESAHRLSNLLPLTYAVDAMKWAWVDSSSNSQGQNIGVLFGTIVVCGAISAWRFRWE